MIRIIRTQRILVDCDSCGTTEDLGEVWSSNAPTSVEEILAVITRPDRKVAVRKNGKDVDYYDKRVWTRETSATPLLLCPACGVKP